MLGKLIKYEFKATGRVFLPLFGALLVMSLITKLMISLQWQAPRIIGMVLSIVLMVAAFVMVLILTVQRFYKNFLSQEGYLMFTLPTGTGNLISAKLIVATIWTLVCTVVVYLSIAIIAFDGTEWQALVDGIRELGLSHGNLTWFIIEFSALVFASLIAGIVMIYFSIALSMVSNNHRVALSIAFYLALSTVMQIIITAVLYLFVTPTGITVTADNFNEVFTQATLSTAHWGLNVTLLVTLICGAAMFLGTRYMLQKKLNLQ